MTKEQWLAIRELEEIPKEVWFEFYKEQGGLIDNIDIFFQMFSEIVAQQAIMIKNMKPWYVNFNTALSSLYSHYNTKFKI